MTSAAVADAIPLIALQQVGQLELLRALFAQVTIPTAVALGSGGPNAAGLQGYLRK